MKAAREIINDLTSIIVDEPRSGMDNHAVIQKLAALNELCGSSDPSRLDIASRIASGLAACPDCDLGAAELATWSLEAADELIRQNKERDDGHE